MPTPKTAPALVLTLGGAPATWHQVVGLPGYYHPAIPTPIGGPGEPTLEQAKACHEDPGCAVELTRVPLKRVGELRDLQLEQRGVAVRAVREQAEALDGAEVEQARDELAAAGGAETTTNDDSAGDEAGEEA